MLHIIAKINNKIQLKLNKSGFVSHPNLSIGKNFKLGNFTTNIIHSTSSATFGQNIDIRNNFNLVLGKNANLTIGDNVFLNNGCSINCLESIVIGENTLFGENVKLYDHNHRYDTSQTYHKEFKTDSIIIGKNCWLGSNTIVLKGVNIGDNVIIGAGCVIHKDVPANSIIVNKQEQIIKQKF
ncbi:acyltransferase [Empedobacter sp. GD03861]|uniref:acyltransferase n=1 Tax=Empedobacter sp. GD03861 TaxID=2975390 RepID=UPI002447F9D1|nr:acyltransferase [Empedobacter sp. GD03861]MDH0673324.1 acyltransferase [Empedobacter sp. GD03861]